MITLLFQTHFVPLILLDMKNNNVVPWVLNSILSKYIPSQNPHVRQAACIWLLSLVKKLSQDKEILVGKNATIIHYSFLKLCEHVERSYLYQVTFDLSYHRYSPS